MSEIKVNSISSLSGSNGPVISGIATMVSSGAMTLPRGDTAFRDGRMGRGLFAGGFNSPLGKVVNISYIQISTTGNTQIFGDLSQKRDNLGGFGSSTRGVFGGGNVSPDDTNIIDYVTISSTGSAADFGDLSTTKQGMFSVSNNVRGIFAGGNDSPIYYPDIEYVTIASKGNSSYFGDMIEKRSYAAAAGSSTRGLLPGGSTPGPTNYRTIEYVTFATTGNSKDFGDLVYSGQNGGVRRQTGAVSNSTRCLIGGGYCPGATSNIEYVTIASLGDGLDFGDLNFVRNSDGSLRSSAAKMIGASVSDSIRGVFAGGQFPGSPGHQNIIEYVNIATLGDGILFGDLPLAMYSMGGCSDSHGGIG